MGCVRRSAESFRKMVPDALRLSGICEDFDAGLFVKNVDNS